jgi:predicted dehydrogenase
MADGGKAPGLAVIGCGGISGAHMKAIAAEPRVKLVAAG